MEGGPRFLLLMEGGVVFVVVLSVETQTCCLLSGPQPSELVFVRGGVSRFLVSGRSWPVEFFISHRFINLERSW